MDPSSFQSEVEKLRKLRVRPEREVAAASLFRAAATELSKLQKKLPGIADAWADVCPAALLDKTSIEGIARGILTIKIADASTRYELDSILRNGGEHELIKRSPMAVRKVRLVVGEV